MTIQKPYEYHDPRLSAFESFEWVDRAACGEHDTPVMFAHPSNTADLEYAKSLCDICPVRAECLKHALDAGESWGVWGGTTAEERKQLKRRESRARSNEKRRAGAVTETVRIENDLL